MQELSDDDDGYIGWLKNNPDGFVLNVQRNPSARYTVLHRARCWTISTMREDGAYTARGYCKVVAVSVDELRSYTRSLGRADGSFSHVCGHCKPVAS